MSANFQNRFDFGAPQSTNVQPLVISSSYEISTSDTGSLAFDFTNNIVENYVIRQFATGGAVMGQVYGLNMSVSLAETYARSGDYIGFLNYALQGNDYVTGVNANIVGGGGNDLFGTLEFTNRIIDGGSGTNTGYLGYFSNPSIIRTGEFNFTITNSSYSGGTTVYATNIQRLGVGTDVTAYDINGNAGQAYRLYQAALDRGPDKIGLSNQVNALDHGLNLHDLAANFIASPEFMQRYGANLSNSEFVATLYANTLHRAPDAIGQANWVNALNDGTFDRATVLARFSESQENHINTDPVLVTGIHLDAATLHVF